MSVYFAFKCNSCTSRFNRASFKGVALTEGTQSREEITWGIASWVKRKKMSERVCGFGYDKLPHLTLEILESGREDPKLQELLIALGGDPEVRQAAMLQALHHVSRGYSRYSQCQLGDWLEEYKKYPNEIYLIDEGDLRFLDDERRMLVNESVEVAA